MMQQEEVDLIAMMDGRANESILTQGAQFTIVWNQGLSIGGQGWIVPVGAPNRTRRHETSGYWPCSLKRRRFRPPALLRADEREGLRFP